MFIIDKNVFLEKINLASGFVSQKYGGSSILQGILLEGKDNILRIYSTNLNQYFKTKINIKLKNDFSIIIEPQKIIEFLSLLDPGEINIKIEDQKKIIINKDKTTGSFPLIKYEEYPFFPKISEKTQKIKTKELINNIERVIFSASKDDTRPILSSVCFDFDEKNFFIISTDGFRLSLLKLKKETNNIGNISYIIPATFLNMVLRLMKEEEIEIGFNNEEKTIFFKNNNDLFISRLIDGDFPQYNKVIPQQTKTKIFVDKDDFLKAIKIISIFARDQSNIVILETKNNSLLIKPKTETEEGETEIDAKIEGEKIKIAFNFKFIIDFLRHLPSEKKTVIASFLRNDSPALFTLEGEDNYLHIIMPIRIQE